MARPRHSNRTNHRSLALLALLAGCADVGTEPHVVWRVEVESGSGQTAAANAQLPQPMVVRALNRAGDPVAGASVYASATAGGRVTPSPVATDADGRASLTWTLGRTPGTQTLTASVAALFASAHATAVNAASPAPPPGTPPPPHSP